LDESSFGISYKLNSLKRKITQLKDKLVLITGGASKIGKIMVRLMLKRKAKVIIWDIDQSGIDKIISDFSSLGFIAGFQIDVSNTSEIQETVKKVKQEFDSINVLINNAGIVVGEYFHDHSTSDIINTMEINATDPDYHRVFKRDDRQKLRTYL